MTEEIYAYGEARGVKMTKRSETELAEDEEMRWVYELFPEDAEKQEEYLEKGDAEEIKVKYVMYHSLLEEINKRHRNYVREKVKYGKRMGWKGSGHATEEHTEPNRE